MFPKEKLYQKNSLGDTSKIQRNENVVFSVRCNETISKLPA